MNLEIEQELIAVAKKRVADKTTSLGASEHKVELAKYLDQQRFEGELGKIFKKLPSILCHSSELSEANSYCAVTTAMGSLIVSRDAGGQAHVFYNSCRHRGAKLVAGKACRKSIVCPYHAWSYGTDGKLGAVPGQNQCFPNLNKDENGLIALPSVEKYGFVWLCPEAEGLQSAEAHLDTHLAGMGSHFDWLQADQLTFYKRTSKVWRGNWKLFAEGGLETYHFAFAHRDTIAPSFYNNVAVIDQIDQHFRVMMPTRALQSGPAESIHDCSHTLFFILPSAALLVQKEHVDWIQFRPLATDKTDITITSLIPKSADLDDEKQRNHWHKNHKITNATLDEDWALGESIQASLSSGALPYIQYGKNEWALHAFGEILEQLLAAE